MIFSSIVFIFFFLPIVLVVFHSLRKSLRFPFLLLSSLFFYFFGENYLIWIMLTTIVVDYFSGLLIAGGLNQKPIVQLIPNGHRSNLQKFWLTVSIISNLSLLGFFKYFNFFTDNIIQVLDLLHLSHLKLDGLIKISLMTTITGIGCVGIITGMTVETAVVDGSMSTTQNIIIVVRSKSCRCPADCCSMAVFASG